MNRRPKLIFLLNSVGLLQSVCQNTSLLVEANVLFNFLKLSSGVVGKTWRGCQLTSEVFRVVFTLCFPFLFTYFSLDDFNVTLPWHVVCNVFSVPRFLCAKHEKLAVSVKFVFAKIRILACRSTTLFLLYFVKTFLSQAYEPSVKEQPIH